MSKITETETKHVADLIKIDIPNSEYPKYSEQLERSLNPAADLAELDTDETEILSHPTGLTTNGAADEVEPGLDTEGALLNAKNKGNELLGYIKVAQVLND